jgi:hypothetical protein
MEEAVNTGIIITLDRDQLPQTRVTTIVRGVEEGYTVGIHTLSDIFKQTADGVSQTLDLPWIDLLGTEVRMAFHQTFGGKHAIVWSRPSMERTIRVQDDETRTLTFPPITWAIQWNMGNVTVAKLFISTACPTKLDDPIRLYPFPYGNVYDAGAICWGDGNIAAGITTRCPTPEAVDHFFFHGAPFNTDLAQEDAIGDDGLYGLGDGDTVEFSTAYGAAGTLRQIIGGLK